MKAKSKVKKWSIYNEPKFYKSAPQMPRKTIENISCIDHATLTFDRDGEVFKLSDLTLLNDKTLPDVSMRASIDYIYEDDPEITIRFFTQEATLIANVNYDKEMAKYKRDYAKYKEEKEQHKKDLEEYSVWKKEQEGITLANQLKKAEELLRKHGKI